VGGPPAASPAPVTLEEDDASYALSNGILSARISKQSGDLTSLVYQGIETLTDRSGHAGGYWSHDARSERQTRKVTIDPSTNGGARAEVSVKGISGGKALGSGPGGGFPADIEIRYSLGRGESGVYTYCIFEHQPEYPAAALGEARYCAKLATTFDWLSVDTQRNKYYPRVVPGEDKYVYTAVQSENLAYGWSSTTQHIGWWIVNPSIEYLSGGPTKVEFLCHRDTTAVQAPCVLNYWRSSHYGGATVNVAHDDHWTKVIGPFMIYCNSGGDASTLWQDARAQAEREAKKWPYDWVSGIDYPHSNERSSVSGQIALSDPFLSGAKFPGQLMVGLAHAAYDVENPRGGPNAEPRHIDWQTDARYYQFWARGEPDGRFRISAVRPGQYTLHAFAKGVLGEFARTDVVIEPGGEPVELGTLPWTPIRHGRPLWEVGIPNRTAAEFAGGDRYYEPDTPLQYPRRFPDDVNFIIGKSDPAKDWYFEQVPHNEDPSARVVPFFGVKGNGRATPFSITFDLPAAPRGKATLRLALCAASTRTIDVSVNGKPAGPIDRLPGGDATIPRHGIRGIWYEREVPFDAALMKQGTNVLTLTVPAGPVNNGVIYDYLRLELDEPKLASIFIAGDSTAANGAPGAIGWGRPFPAFFDPARANVINAARGGRSSRTFITEGHWDRLLSDVKPGDFVLIEFGHNDGGAINDERRARGSLPGLGDETQEIDNKPTGQHEIVHTYGWYMRKMIADTRARGATPILLSLTVRNIWTGDKVELGSGKYRGWIRDLAREQGVACVDLTRIIADRYEQMGRDAVEPLFPRDHTHTSDAGAELNARCVVAGLKALHRQLLIRLLSPAGRALDPAPQEAVLLARVGRPVPDASPHEQANFLNVPEPADPALPSVYLIGDSTVRNGRGDGASGQWGWGDPLSAYFDPARVNLVNRALGGTGARTYLAGQWPGVLALLKPGDIVVMQFGHNDNGPRGALRGTGEETEDRTTPDGGHETVHTYGWYLRKYIADTRARGATPIVCTLIPRNLWDGDAVARPQNSHADWARAVARAEGVPLLDLHEAIAQRYDQMGKQAVAPLFADERVHTNAAGAELNAACVISALRALPEDPLARYLRSQPAATW
jgi:rhamnogalacturonan endolyase